MIMQHAVEFAQGRIVWRDNDAAHFGFDGGKELSEVGLEVRGWKFEIEGMLVVRH